MESKTVRNDLYIENVWLRILAALFDTFFVAVLVVLVGILLGVIHSLHLITGFQHMTKDGQWTVLFGLVVVFLIFVGILGTKETLVSETPALEVRMPERRRGNFNLVLGHGLPQGEALRRIQLLLAEVKAQHGDKIDALEEQWDGNKGTFRLCAKGYWVSGTLTVEPTRVELNGDIPFSRFASQGKDRTNHSGTGAATARLKRFLRGVQEISNDHTARPFAF